MANRKVLINRHSTRNQAPVASEMFHGEIAVSHPSDLSATTIWTRNVDVMVPFASCAMTMQMIDNAITAADVTYDVKAAEGDAHVEVVSGGDEKAKVFTVSSKDVMSEKEFKAYSARTAEAVEGLMNMLITAVTGEGVIEVEPEKTGATGYNIKHKEAKKVALGFNKVATDDYGHVIDYSAVTADDINAVINVAELSAATKALSAGTQHDIEALSGNVVEYVKVVSGNIETVIQAMDKAASAENGKVVTTVSEVDGVVSETKANVKDLQLGGYSKDAAATGAIAATDTINAALSKLENKAAAITIANADKSINVTTGATGTDINVNIKSDEKVLAKDGAAGLYTDIDLVKITTGLPATVKERYQLLATDDSQIGVNIDVPKDSHIVSINFISDPADAHYQNLEYKYIDAEGTEQTTYVDVSSLVLEAEFASGVTVTDHIAHGVVDPASEDFLTVGGAGFKLSGVQDAIDAKVNALDVTDDAAVAGQYVAAIEQTDGVVAVKSRANVSEAVLTNYAKGTDGSAVAATDSVREAIGKLENQIDNAKAAATTKVVEGTDVGNNMTITPSTGADGSVTYTVDLTDVASKAALDAEIAARKAVDGQDGQTYAANTGATYITGATSLNDADMKLDTALKAVADQVEGLDYTGLTDENTKVVTDVKQENGLVSASATTVGDLVITAITTADTKVAADDNLATIAGKLQGQINAMDSTGATTATGHYLTSVTITDGKISAVGEEALPAATPVTTVNGTTGTTVAPVLTGIVTGGTEGHKLTLNYTNKVLSAQTADEAAHASAATKVDSALTLTDVAGTNKVEFDGSANKTVTFGTATSIANENSMTMSDAGVVDVNIIDCGEY